jgi:hypothetical protein
MSLYSLLFIPQETVLGRNVLATEKKKKHVACSFNCAHFHRLFSQLSINEHLNHFPFLPFSNNVAMIIFASISLLFSMAFF